MNTAFKAAALSWLRAAIAAVAALYMAGVTDPAELNTVVISLKSISLTAIFFIAYTYRKKEATPKWAVPVIFLLTTLNIVLAVLVGAAE
jgi:hypothetical protein